MTKEQLLSMFEDALNHANYYKTDRKESWNGLSKELRLDEGVIRINKALSDPPCFNIIFFPHVNYAVKNNLGTKAFDFSLSYQEFFDLEFMFDKQPNQRSKQKVFGINIHKGNPTKDDTNGETNKKGYIPLKTYIRYKQSYPNLFDAEIIERLGNELSDKVETLQNLNTINQELVNQITNQTSQAVWHDADKVFPEFDEEILGYYEIESGDLTHRIHAICKLKSIHEDQRGKHPYYEENGDSVPLLFWTELNDCPFSSMDKQTKNQENEIN